MMNISDTNAWKVLFSEDDSLNFAMFVGCAYGIADPYIDKNMPWPYGKTALPLPSQEKLQLLTVQWKQWWSELVEHRIKQVNGSALQGVSKWYFPPRFSNLDLPELRELCLQAWPYFCDWWQLPAGGKIALAWYSAQASQKISKCIHAFETASNRQIKPFQLHIDLIYTGVGGTLQVTPEYLIVFSPNLILRDDWWMEKLNQIG